MHTRRNLLAPVRRRDHGALRADVRAISQAPSQRAAQAAARRVHERWQRLYPQGVRSLERDLPELLAFFRCPRPLWRRLRTTNIIERCVVEVRRRTRPMVCFVNVRSVDRILYAIFNRFNLEWAQHTPPAFTQAA